MLASAAFAFALPFETFLLAYAILGPLHYLTQISWLHERKYFTQGSRDWMLLALMAVVVTALALFGLGGDGAIGADLILWCLGWSLIAVVTNDTALRVAGGVVCAAAVFLLHGARPATVLGSLWVPTLIHVYLFTGLFILYGTLKGRSVTGWVSLVVFLACGAATLLLDVGTLGYVASDYARDGYAGTMGNMHWRLMETSGFSSGVVPPAGARDFPPFGSLDAMLGNEASIRAGRFIGYAYTYHYLNWFSKTSVIFR
jgi:hypothetical protein